MECPAILTGEQFLTRVLANIDCQAAFLGSYGWQALGQPGSLAATVMTGLLTLFIAIFGIRLLFGPTPGARDVVGDVLKIGIVLTLAFSWPAFRTLIHDVVLEGPGELAASAGAPIMPEGTGLVERLQDADNAMLRLTEQGTGRQTGAYVNPDDPGGTFMGQALEDEKSFGQARLIYLAGLLGSYGLLRLVAGLLLALAPLAAGMLLFELTLRAVCWMDARPGAGADWSGCTEHYRRRRIGYSASLANRCAASAQLGLCDACCPNGIARYYLGVCLDPVWRDLDHRQDCLHKRVADFACPARLAIFYAPTPARRAKRACASLCSIAHGTDSRSHGNPAAPRRQL